MLKKELDNRRPSKYLIGILTFFLPVSLLLISFISQGMYPFGDRSILLVDGKLQYVSFFSEFVRQMRAHELPLFSRYFGLGMNFFGTWAYYLSSPVNLILLAFPKTRLLEGIFTVLLVKVGLCGSSFYLYARKTLLSDSWIGLLFSTSYALCGFVVYYSDNMQWLDGVIWLPIVIIGIEEIYRNKYCLYYPFIISILIFSNFYISIITGIFCLFYSVYIVLRENSDDFPGKKWQFLLRIAWNSLLGIGMAAIILIPVYLLLKNQMGLIGQTESCPFFTGNPVETLGGLLIGRRDSFTQYGFPKIYSGLLAVVVAPAYFLSSAVKKRERIASALFLAFVFLCFHISGLNFFWHGLDYVGWFPFRYSFVFSFLILTIAVKAMHTPDNIMYEHRNHFLSFTVLLALLCFVSFFCVWKETGLLVTAILLAANILLIFCYSYFLRQKSSKKGFLAFLLSMELLISTTFMIKALNSEGKYANYNVWTDTYQKIENIIDEYDLHDQSGRTAIALRTLTGNDPLLFGLPGIDYYSSAGSEIPVKTLFNFGYTCYISEKYEISDNGGSQLLNSLMGVSSTIAESSVLGNEGSPPTEFPVRHQISSEYLGDLEWIRNSSALSTAYLVNEKVLSFSSENITDNPFALDDRLLSDMLGQETTTYAEVPYTLTYENAVPSDEKDYIRYSIIDADVQSNIYLTFAGKGQSTALYLNLQYYQDACKKDNSELTAAILYKGKVQIIKYANTMAFPAVLSLGSFPDGEKVEVRLSFCEKDLCIMYLRLVSQNSVTVEKALEPLRENQGTVTWTSSRTAEIEESSDTGGILFVSIPYDEGWSVKVNGKSTDIIRVANAFIGIKLNSGDNTVEMSFCPQGIRESLCISLACLIAALIQIPVIHSVRMRKFDR